MILGLLDRTMQLLDIPPSQDDTGYHIVPTNGNNMTQLTSLTLCLLIITSRFSSVLLVEQIIVIGNELVLKTSRFANIRAQI